MEIEQEIIVESLGDRVRWDGDTYYYCEIVVTRDPATWRSEVAINRIELERAE